LRELPIQADYVGRFTATTPDERVEVALARAADASDEVAVIGTLDADTP
jgi:pyrimidine operon attenuation protein/uracil phosphoribosyltransferase